MLSIPHLRPAIAAFAFLLLLSTVTAAQPQLAAPKSGFWVVETAKEPNRRCTVYFYNDEQQLVYQEKLDRSRLNISRPKVRQRLNGVLEQAIVQWTATKQLPTDRQWLAVAFRK